ncbi:MAG: hypothetical protein EPN75_03900 [Beijerinckiaceae bacterium]|nr:MAG: hypothetical protein EPN75_03900 [Beijerinckiaceae bacterium]
MPGPGTATNPNARIKAAISYEIVLNDDGWTILQGDRTLGTLNTRMAAFDTAVQSAMADMLSGNGVSITVPGEPG